MFSKFRFCLRLLLWIIWLTACAPAPTLLSSTSTPPQPTPSQTQPAVTLPAIDSPTQLVPIGSVRAFPGPEHYAGDILTFGIQAPPGFDESVTLYMALDDGKPTQATETFY